MCSRCSNFARLGKSEPASFVTMELMAQCELPNEQNAGTVPFISP